MSAAIRSGALDTEAAIDSIPAGGAETVAGECPQHGEWTSPARWLFGNLVNRRMPCPACSDLLAEAETRHEGAAKVARRRAVRAKRYTDAGMPRKFLPGRVGPYVPANDRAVANLEVVREFGETFGERLEDGGSLVLSGKPGNGKTHLAVVLGCSLLDDGRSVRYTTAAAMLRYVRGAYGRDAGYSETAALARYVDPDLLILDEVGTKLASDHDRATLFEVIDQRYQREAPSILITNLCAGEIGAATDERLADRLKQLGKMLLFDWASYRSGAGR